MKRRKINENFILRLEMIVLLTVSLIAVTIAWFVLSNFAKVNSLKLQAGDSDYIKVAVSANDVDILQLPETERYVEIGMPEFENTRSGELAPGTYGEINIYVTALNPVVEGCSISVNSVPEYTPDVTAENATVGKVEIDKLLKGHIQFYSTCEVNGDNQRDYSGLITEENPLMIPLTEDIEKKVTIYWVWPYEYTDIPTEAVTAFSQDKTYFFDKDKYDSSLDGSGQYKTEHYISFYDYGDTKLGLHVKDIHFHICVNGLNYSE